MTLQVVEILGRAVQGMSRPFLCRCNDGELYYVKGRNTDRRSLVCEWIAGKLGRTLGLPIAAFDIVEVPAELVGIAGAVLEADDLGAGPAFASRKVEIMEIMASTVAQVPQQQQCDVLAFDWWIRNNDRLLTATGGNPNLFWKPGSGELVVIDHNQAFAPDFDPNKLLDYHVFSGVRDAVFGDMLQREHYTEQFAEALIHWADITAAIPEHWHYIDPEMTLPVSFDIDDFRATLERCQREDFWHTP